MNMPTEEQIRSAAAKCPLATATLKTLFPEVFKSEIVSFEGSYYEESRNADWIINQGKDVRLGDKNLIWMSINGGISLTIQYDWSIENNKLIARTKV